MKIYNNINSVNKKFHNSVLAIGNFDGVHLGHQELLRKAYIFSRKIKKKFGIFTFDPLPKDFFNRTNNKILNISDKIDIVRKFRADFFIKQNFNRNFSKISHDNFAKIILLKKLAAHSIFVGKDFKFGFKRKGNIFFLKKLSENLPHMDKWIKLYEERLPIEDKIWAVLSGEEQLKEVKKYSWDKIVEQTEKVYKEVINQNETNKQK